MYLASPAHWTTRELGGRGGRYGWWCRLSRRVLGWGGRWTRGPSSDDRGFFGEDVSKDGEKVENGGFLIIV